MVSSLTNTRLFQIVAEKITFSPKRIKRTDRNLNNRIANYYSIFTSFKYQIVYYLFSFPYSLLLPLPLPPPPLLGPFLLRGSACCRLSIDSLSTERAFANSFSLREYCSECWEYNSGISGSRFPDLFLRLLLLLSGWCWLWLLIWWWPPNKIRKEHLLFDKN